MSNHSFNINEAKKYSIEAAIILHNLRHWLTHNKCNNTNTYDNYVWTYNSLDAFAKLFPYISRSAINRHLKKLIIDGMIITANYNKKGFDRTVWYTIPSEYAISQNGTAESQNGTSIFQNGTTIPNSKPNSKQQIKDIVEQSSDRFSEFWNLYDKKNGLSKCKAKFSKLKKREIELLFKNLPLYIQSTPAKQFRKNPLSWLNGKCWEDEITQYEQAAINYQNGFDEVDYSDTGDKP